LFVICLLPRNRYSINTQDTSNGIPGVLYGRYQGDTYAGGNPWVLSTAALASLLYRGAAHVLQHGAPSAEALAVWQSAFNSPSALPTSPSALAAVFAAQGDGVLLRLRKHVQPEGFHLDEQIDRNSGAQISAEDLTWSVSNRTIRIRKNLSTLFHISIVCNYFTCLVLCSVFQISNSMPRR
jgi:glucoamylase